MLPSLRLTIVLCLSGLTGCFPVRYRPFEARTGVVVDARTHAPLAGARVVQCGFCYSERAGNTACEQAVDVRDTVTNENGRFYLKDGWAWTGGVLAPDGLGIFPLNGAAAGQTVFHYHMHLIPRHHGAGLQIHSRVPGNPERMAETAKRLGDAVRSGGLRPS